MTLRDFQFHDSARVPERPFERCTEEMLIGLSISIGPLRADSEQM